MPFASGSLSMLHAHSLAIASQHTAKVDSCADETRHAALMLKLSTVVKIRKGDWKIQIMYWNKHRRSKSKLIQEIRQLRKLPREIVITYASAFKSNQVN